MSFIYPRTIRITRPGAQSASAVGPQGYAPSSQRPLETQVASDVPASIQARGGGAGKDPTGLPAGNGQVEWRAFTPLGALQDGQVQDRDYVYDDLGRRFQVIADYTNSLGANFGLIRIEA